MLPLVPYVQTTLTITINPSEASYASYVNELTQRVHYFLLPTARTVPQHSDGEMWPVAPSSAKKLPTKMTNSGVCAMTHLVWPKAGLLRTKNNFVRAVGSMKLAGCLHPKSLQDLPRKQTNTHTNVYIYIYISTEMYIIDYTCTCKQRISKRMSLPCMYAVSQRDKSYNHARFKPAMAPLCSKSVS